MRKTPSVDVLFIFLIHLWSSTIVIILPATHPDVPNTVHVDSFDVYARAASGGWLLGVPRLSVEFVYNKHIAAGWFSPWE